MKNIKIKWEDSNYEKKGFIDGQKSLILCTTSNNFIKNLRLGI